MADFNFSRATIEDVLILERPVVQDHRGSLSRIFDVDQFDKILPNFKVQQINFSKTTQSGSIRGIHYQVPPFSEGKVIFCVRGSIWDVAVDLRAGSPTFLKYCFQELSDKNYKAMYLPKGFGHAFQALTDDVEMIYFHTNVYHADSAKAINPFDEKINISWPKKLTVISQNDLVAKRVDQNFTGI